ncbi:MAG TPA: hypothetical protein VEB86_06130 [Chryseosolibacter sp.]|nr:hypothetical protein [Chryseosolibacter sp.]
MKLFQFYLAVTMSSVVFSCSEEEPKPTNKVVIEVKIPSQGYGESNMYIIATGRDGAFLGLKKIEDGQNIVIDTAIASLPDKVNITVLRHSPPSGEWPTDSYSFFTEADVPVGSKWYYRDGEGFSGNGAATVNITNFPSGSFCSISSLKGSGETRMAEAGAVTLSAGFNQSPADLFIGTVGTSQDPRHFKAASVTTGATLDLDYNADFLPYDEVINVPADGHHWLVISRGYNMPVEQITVKEFYTHEFGFFFDTNNNGLRLGFNDGYVNYWTFWYDQDAGMTFEKWGEAPEQSDFEPVQGDFTITNETFNGFDYTTTGTFHYLMSGFDHINSARRVWWMVLRPVGRLTRSWTGCRTRCSHVFQNWPTSMWKTLISLTLHSSGQPLQEPPTCTSGINTARVT